MKPNILFITYDQLRKDALPWYGFEQVALREDYRVGPYGDDLTQHGYDI